MRCFISVWLLTGLLGIGCGGSAPPAKSSDEKPKAASAGDASEEAESSGDESEDEAEDGGPIPTDCAKPSGGCYPSMKFVKRLCDGSYPGVALVMFSGGTPWKRAYLAVREVDPVNAFGGVAGGEALVMNEEVIVLFEKSGNLGGMEVTGSGSYQVLRWDGTCATLASGELREQRPGNAKAAKVTWRYLDKPIKKALREESRISEAVRARKKECKGATMGTVSAKCEKLDQALTETIVDVVREGNVKLPTPAKVP
jgi:hypothetical protein